MALAALCGLAQSAELPLRALADLESGGNDHARGTHGEISRYQILPALWHRYSAGNPTDPAEARRVTLLIWSARIESFTRTRLRAPTPQESYALWNAPGALARTGYVGLSATVRERCERFANLCRRVTELGIRPVPGDQSGPRHFSSRSTVGLLE